MSSSPQAPPTGLPAPPLRSEKEVGGDRAPAEPSDHQRSPARKTFWGHQGEISSLLWMADIIPPGLVAVTLEAGRAHRCG